MVSRCDLLMFGGAPSRSHATAMTALDRMMALEEPCRRNG
jgi:hypothetical protein